MFILCVSDIHLCNNKPHITDGFLNFLYYHAIHATALYILGDLFEMWIGDDDPNPLYKTISDALKYLKQHNTTCYFIHGNHDFLLSKKYAINCNMIVLSHQAILEFYGYKIILLHGDTLCIHDTHYQIFRKYIQKCWIQKLFLSLPISIRLYIIYAIQQHQRNKQHNNILLNIDNQTVTNILSKTNTNIMIHGHLHQAQVHYRVINNTKQIERVVLGNWTNIGSIVEINQHGIYLKKFFYKN